MNKILLIIGIFTNSIVNTQSVFEGRVIYDVQIKVKKLDVSKLDKKKFSQRVIRASKKMYKDAKGVSAYLYFNQTESLYELPKNLLNEADKKMNLTKVFAGNTNKYYVNSVKNEFIYQTNTTGEPFLMSFKPVEWRLIQEQKMIGKYLCFKAISSKTFDNGMKKDIIAWYTPQIPLNFGPLKYNGLPGLILELDDNNIVFKTIKIELNKVDVKINNPLKGTVITSEKYLKVVNNFFKSIKKN